MPPIWIIGSASICAFSSTVWLYSPAHHLHFFGCDLGAFHFRVVEPGQVDLVEVEVVRRVAELDLFTAARTPRVGRGLCATTVKITLEVLCRSITLVCISRSTLNESKGFSVCSLRSSVGYVGRRPVADREYGGELEHGRELYRSRSSPEEISQRWELDPRNRTASQHRCEHRPSYLERYMECQLRPVGL